MSARRVALALLLAGLLGGARAQPATEPQTLTHGLFDAVQVLAPSGAPKQFVLLLGGADGIAGADRQRARGLVAQGAMVALVDTPAFQARLAAEGGKCGFAAGAFENLAHHVQAFFKLPTYLRPMLVGRGSGGALAYAVVAQGEPGSFGPTVSLDFCPQLPPPQPMCAAKALPASTALGGASRLGAAARLPAPWLVLQRADAPSCGEAAAQPFVARVRGAQWRAVPAGETAATAALNAAWPQLAARNKPPEATPATLADLPIVEVPSRIDGRRFAVLLSGDGGWAGIDKALAAALSARGVPVAGFDSLRYFWTARTPEGLAADLDRIVRFYSARWSRPEVILIGYSQGADVLPFAVNRLDVDSRVRMKLAALLSLGQKASFEFHVANWLGPSGDVPVAPEARQLAAEEVLCVHGTDDKESLCPSLAPAHARVVALRGGHHFDGDYDKLARIILEHAPPP